MLVSGRRGLIVLLAAAIAVGPGLAPEHVHERDEDHPQATVHRHLTPHHSEASRRGATMDDNDDDEHVIWLSAAWLQTPAYHVPELVTALVPTAIAPDSNADWTSLVFDDGAPPHGPPRQPHSPRAPPSSV